MTAVIIQARLGSTRLPGKAMKELCGKPLLYYSVKRCSLSKYADKVIVATTTNRNDDKIVRWCEKNNVPYYRGSEEDVLDRYYETSKKFEVDTIVRVTSDCPFIDSEIIDMLVLISRNFNYDDVVNRWKKRTWPHGLDIEVIKFRALEIAWKKATEKEEREHVTPYILKNPEKFSIFELPYKKDLSKIRLTVDYPEDFEFARVLIEKFEAHKMNWKELVRLLEEHPEIVAINAKRVNPRL